MTYQIIYASESSTPLQTDDLEELLQHARASNARQGITGALVYADRIFLQVLEGDRAAVTGLMQKIARDLRHEHVTLLQEADVAAPVFGDWGMAYVSATQQQVAQWAGLAAITQVPELQLDFQQDSQRAARIAQGILALLKAEAAG